MCGYVKTQRYGGSGGGAFSDDLTEACQLVQVTVRHGTRVDSIESVWSTPSGATFTGARHGGGGGSPSTFTLEKEEYITRIDGRSGSSVDQLTFTTNKGNKFGPYGKDGGSPFSIADVRVFGFFGSSGSSLDAIGFFTPGKC
jgi:hypothetical protein